MYNSNFKLAETLTDLDGLVNNLLLLLSEKEKFVIRRRFNLDGKGKATLEEVGREFSITRERIRQIEKNALGKMKRNVFNTSLKELHSQTSFVVRDHGGLRKKNDLVDDLVEGFIPREKLKEGSMDLALNLHEDIDFVGNTINFHPHAREKSIPDFSIKSASAQLLNQMRKYGDARPIEKIHKDLKPVFDDVNFDITGLRSLVNIDKRMTVLDNDLVALLEWRHINPRTLRDKILYVLRNIGIPMHFADISKKIDENNFDNKRINLQAVHNELIRHDQFVLIGRGIYALSEWGYESGTVADVVESILKEKKELSQEEIVDLVLKKRQVKKITVLLSLKNSDRFTRLGRKHYKIKDE